jgi:hypothetical protein
MQFKHAPAAVSARFDDPNLVSTVGLVPLLRLAAAAGFARLAQERLTVPADKGANAGATVASLVAGMLAGADSIDDMNVLRHGGMGKLFDSGCARSLVTPAFPALVAVAFVGHAAWPSRWGCASSAPAAPCCANEHGRDLRPCSRRGSRS